MLDLTLACLSGAAVAAGWLLASPRLAESIYRTAIFEAHKFPRGDWSLDWLKDYRYDEVFFKTDKGQKLHGIFVLQENAPLTIVINHGNTGNVADMNVLVTLLLQCDVNVFLYDYRGFGKSESIENVSHACEDAVAAYDYASHRLPNIPIVLYGESIGGAFSTYAAQRRHLAGLILQSCFSEFKKIACEHYAIFALWPKLLFPWPYLNNASGLAIKQFPVLIMHGANDKEVNLKHSTCLYNTAQEPRQLVILPNTAHEEISELDAPLFLASVKQFLQSIIQTPANATVADAIAVIADNATNADATIEDLAPNSVPVFSEK